MPIVMNVGPSAIGSAGGGGSGGGQTLGSAHGDITINVHNVTQANNILQNSGRQMQQAFNNAGRAARANSQITIAAVKAQAAQTQAAAKQIIAGHQVTASAARTSAVQQRTAHQSILQPIQQQIAANRLLVSNIGLQAAQARAAATAQRQAAQQSVTAWQGVNQQLNKVRTEMAAVSIGAGLLAGAGIKYAATMQEGRIQLEGMTGSVEKGTKLMDQLGTMGAKARVPMRDMLTFSTQLLPVLEGNTKELDRWFDVTRRLAILNRGPVGGIQGATFSLREAFLSAQQGGRDFVSLADRFNISKKLLGQALEDTGGDFLKAIDLVLTKMGITTDTADKMAASFNASFTLAKESALQLLSQGFEPLLAVMGPILQLTAEWARMLRQTAPEVSFLAAGILTVITVGTPLLLLVNQLTIAWTNMGNAAQLAALKAGKVGGVIAGVAIGAAVGRNIGLRIGGMIRESQGKKPLTEEQVNQNLKIVMFDIIVLFTRFRDAFGGAILDFQATIIEVNAGFKRTMAGVYSDLAANSPFGKKWFSDKSTSLNSEAFSEENRAAQIRKDNATAIANMWTGVADLGKNWGLPGFQGDSGSAGASLKSSGFSRDQEDIIVETYQKLNEIAREEGKAIVAETRQWSEQRTQTIRNYEKNIARESRDFARQREQAERRFNLSMLDATQESAIQRRKWAEEFERSLQDRREEMGEEEQELREDSGKRIKEIEENYAEEREKALLDHRDRILKAASHLDAEAIREEEMRFARESIEKKKEHDKQIAKEEENVQERLDDQEKAFKKFEKQQKESLALRLKEQKEDDDRRRWLAIRDFEAQKEEEDRERGIRLADQAIDFQEDLDEMDRQHALKMQDIAEQAAEERTAAWAEHQTKLAEVGLQTAAWALEHAKLVNDAIANHRRFWLSVSDIGKAAPQFPSIANPFVSMKPYPGAGPVPQPQSTRSISIGGITVQILGSTNMSPTEVYVIAKRAMVDALEGAIP